MGYAILESYSRVIESLASTVMSRIEDVHYADFLTRNQSTAAKANARFSMVSSPNAESKMSQNSEDEDSDDTPTSRTLSDFMGWSLGQGEADNEKKNSLRKESRFKEVSDQNKLMNKPANINTKRFSYLEKLDNFSLRSPTARH